MLTPFERLPEPMQCDEVRAYWEILSNKRGSLLLKRCFDLAVSAVGLVCLSPVMLIVAAAVKIDSKGPALFRQQRITRDGKTFTILKFRSMTAREGALVTAGGDARITKVGALIRRTRLDELPQLVNVLKGEMSFVGTRPEVARFVDRYSPEMLATLLMPAGITSRCSILFLDEEEMLREAKDVEAAYLSEILPIKMRYNLEYLRDFSFFSDIQILFATFFAFGRKPAAEKRSAHG